MKSPAVHSSQSIAIACLSAALIAATGYSFYISKKDEVTTDSDEVSTHSSQNAVSDTNIDTQAKKLVPGEIELSSEKAELSSLQRIQTSNTITIAYASTTGTCKSFAESLLIGLSNITAGTNIKIQICTVDELDWWDELLNNENDESATATPQKSLNADTNVTLPPMVVFILPTWTNGTLPEQYAPLLTSLDEISHDWRVAPRPLRAEEESKKGKGSGRTRIKHKSDTKTMQIASFGMGSTAYDKSTFCKPAKDVFKVFMKLGARSLLVSHGKGVVGTGDDDAGDCKQAFKEWKMRVVSRVEDVLRFSQDAIKEKRGDANVEAGADQSSPKACSQQKDEKASANSCACQEEKTSSEDGGGCCQSNETEEKVDDDNQYSNDNEDDEDDDSDYSDDSDWDEEEEKEEPDVMDLEDIGNAMQTSKSSNSRKVVKEMVTPKQAVSLKKEGYKIIGTHSAVKLCRWTKHQLRGRGGCYKHTFYGITSYQCMEATPSLACANKCVFCWRHHKNPVGREWRWKIDDPNEIVDLAVKEHVAMIKETRGIPGVKKDRWEEAHTVRHCALSLVGEPIMYPRIDEFLADLHRRSISTFLVTNGQHPAAIESLRPITQLYVSVDASTPETLEAIDRPLFKDAWDRLRTSLKSLKTKGQRTVARLTVVKGWNSDEVSGYAKLIALGHCSLVEIKGVTFCGKSDASNLNMTNSPWHHEVVALAQILQKELAKLRAAAGDNEEKIPEYGLACEHKHSCSVLLARVDQFSVDDPVTGKRKWRTWIDYDKFDRLAARYAEDPTFTFGVKDYVEDTPIWAVFGAEEEGFDPTDTRHRRKRKYPKYTKFDVNGIPTHDDNGEPLSESEKKKLIGMMTAKKRELGDGVSVLDLKGGEKVIDDASLMFRGLTVTK